MSPAEEILRDWLTPGVALRRRCWILKEEEEEEDVAEENGEGTSSHQTGVSHCPTGYTCVMQSKLQKG